MRNNKIKRKKFYKYKSKKNFNIAKKKKFFIKYRSFERKDALKLIYHYYQIVFWFIYLHSEYNFIFDKVRCNLWLNFFTTSSLLRNFLFCKLSVFYSSVRVKDYYAVNISPYLGTSLLIYVSRALFLFGFPDTELFDVEYITPLRFGHLMVTPEFVPFRVRYGNRINQLLRRISTIKKLKYEIFKLREKSLITNSFFFLSKKRKKLLLKKKVRDTNTFYSKFTFLRKKNCLKLDQMNRKLRLFKKRTFFFRGSYVTTRRISAKEFRRIQTIKRKSWKKKYPPAEFSKIF